MAETWETLEAGTYVRLMRYMSGTAEEWPPKVRSWLVPPSAPPAGPVTEVSIGMLVQFSQFWLDECPATEVIKLHYGKSAETAWSAYPPGHVAGYLVRTLPAVFGGAEPRVHVTKDGDGTWRVRP